MSNLWSINAEAVNGSPLISAIPTLTTDGDRYYVLELVDDSGNLLRVLDDYDQGVWEEEVGKPSMLRFRYPADVTYIADITNPNYVHIRKADGNTLVAQFQIVVVEWQAGNNGKYITVECMDGLGELGHDAVNKAYYADSNAMPTDVLNELLAGQTAASPITLGYIAPQFVSTPISLRVRNKSIQWALNKITEKYGGMMAVNADRELLWQSTDGYREAHEIRLDKNALSFTKRQDWREGELDTSYDFQAIDLGALGTEYEFEARLATLGTLARLYCETPSINILLWVTSIERNLDAPFDIQLGLSDTTRTRNNPGRRPRLHDYMTQTESSLSEKVTADDVIDILGDPTDPYYSNLMETLQDALAEAGIQSNLMQTLQDALLGTGIQSTGSANSDGTATTAARVDHVHKGVWNGYTGS